LKIQRPLSSATLIEHGLIESAAFNFTNDLIYFARIVLFKFAQFIVLVKDFVFEVNLLVAEHLGLALAKLFELQDLEVLAEGLLLTRSQVEWLEHDGSLAPESLGCLFAWGASLVLASFDGCT